MTDKKPRTYIADKLTKQSAVIGAGGQILSEGETLAEALKNTYGKKSNTTK